MAHHFTDIRTFDDYGEPLRPEDHINDHGGPILMIGGEGYTGNGLRPEDILWFAPEPIEHGFALWFKCGGCGQKWTAAIDFDEMEVSDG